MDEKQIREWLSRVADLHKNLLNESEFGQLKLCMCSKQGVQLYNCARKIVRLLDIPHHDRIIKYNDGSFNPEISFFYDGVKFYELEDYQEELHGELLRQAVMSS